MQQLSINRLGGLLGIEWRSLRRLFFFLSTIRTSFRSVRRAGIVLAGFPEPPTLQGLRRLSGIVLPIDHNKADTLLIQPASPFN